MTSEIHNENFVEKEGGEIKIPEESKEPIVNLEESESIPVDSKSTHKLDHDILMDSYETLRSMSIWKIVHWAVAVAATVVCIFVWRYVEDETSDSFWWWIVPMFAFSISLTLHYKIESKQYEDGIIKAAILLNIMLYLTNILTMDTDHYVFFWWIYPALLSLMVLVPYYRYSSGIKNHNTMVTAIKAASPTADVSPYQIDWFKLAIFEYVCTSLVLFFTWTNTKLGHPWFLYPILVLASPLILWRMKKSKENRLWVLAIPQIIIINAIVFVAWAFTSSKIPWFVPVFVISCVGIVLVWFKWKRENDKQNKIKELEINLSRDLNARRNDAESQNNEVPSPDEIVIQ